ncbi:MAG: hypothetical protein WAU86_21780 [Oricola sp.]
MTNSDARRRHISRIMLAAAVSLASVASLPGQALAGSSSTNAVTQKQASLQQKSGAARTARQRITSSGSPYICVPSGFGRKGRCVLRASLR